MTRLNPKDQAAREANKTRLDLIPPAASEACARALMHGAAKYSSWNWRTDPIVYSVYIAAIKRHVDAIMGGEDTDLDSNIHHLGHVLAGASILLDAMKHNCLTDDRPHTIKK